MKAVRRLGAGIAFVPVDDNVHMVVFRTDDGDELITFPAIGPLDEARKKKLGELLMAFVGEAMQQSLIGLPVSPSSTSPKDVS